MELPQSELTLLTIAIKQERCHLSVRISRTRVLACLPEQTPISCEVSVRFPASDPRVNPGEAHDFLSSKRRSFFLTAEPCSATESLPRRDPKHYL